MDSRQKHDYSLFITIIIETLVEHDRLKLEPKYLHRIYSISTLKFVLMYWMTKSSLVFEKKQTLLKLFACLYDIQITAENVFEIDAVSYIEELVEQNMCNDDSMMNLGKELINLIQNTELLEDQDIDMNTVD